MTISEIENISYAEAEVKAIEKTIVKGHTVFFVDFGDAFGYSALVFKNNRHIHYANEYELHHNYFVEEHGKSRLRGYFTELLKHKLFTDEELETLAESYDEYKRKLYFIINYYLQRYDTKSIYKTYTDGINKNVYTAYSPVSFCYVKSANIVKTQLHYFENIKQSFETLKNDDKHFRSMMSYELANYEAGVTGDYHDTLAALGLKYDELSKSQQTIVTEELSKLINR